MLISMSCCSVASFVRLLRLANCLSIMAARSKFVTDAIKCCIHVFGDGKSIKYSQDQSSIMLLFEHNFFCCCFWGDAQKHNVQIFEHNVYNAIIDQP